MSHSAIIQKDRTKVEDMQRVLQRKDRRSDLATRPMQSRPSKGEWRARAAPAGICAPATMLRCAVDEACIRDVAARVLAARSVEC
jgi:hypothetical protein